MENYDYKNILKTLNEASPAHLALASFIVFPIILDYWLEVLLKLFPSLSDGCKAAAVIFLIAIYIICLVWLAKDSSNKRTLEIMRDKVLGKLSSNNWTAMGFDSALQALEESATEKDIHKLIQTYPKTLRFVKLKVPDEKGLIKKDAEGNIVTKPGIALVKSEDV